MSRYFLKRISIEGFRGINNEGIPLIVNLDLDKPNSIFGANAFGKSSIYEALCYAIRGDIAKLEELQTYENPTSYFVNRFHGDEKATVQIEFVSDDASPETVVILTERTANGSKSISSPSGHPDPEAFLSYMNQPFALLDHKTFSKFIDDSALNRGKSFSALLGMDEYLQLGEMLKYVSNSKVLETDLEITSLGSQITGLNTGIATTNAQIAIAFQIVTQGSMDPSLSHTENSELVLEALKQVPMLNPSITTDNFDDVDFDRLVSVVRDAEMGDERSELSALLQAIAALNLVGPKPANQDADIAAEKVELLARVQRIIELFQETRGAECRHFYQEAITFLETGEWTEPLICPLCESDLSTPISEQLESRMAKYVAVESEISGLDEYWNNSNLNTRIAALENCDVLDVSLFGPSENYTTLAGIGSITEQNIVDAVSRLTNLEELLKDTLESKEQRKLELERELPASLVQLTGQIEAARSFKTAVSQSIETENKSAQLSKRLEVLSRWKEFIGEVSKRFTESESALATSHMGRIDASFKEMFKDVMCTAIVVPELQRRSGDQLEVMLQDFYGLTGLSARALLSESYRNALAISLYLTAAVNHVSQCGFVVLDDVTSSFDGGHQIFLMNYIRQNLQYGANPAGVQFLILSHDGFLEKYFNNLADDSLWRHHRMLGSPPEGPTFLDYENSQHIKDKALDFIRVGNHEAAKPLVRQYLEYTLLQIIRKVRIPVPIDFSIKDHERMLGNCTNAIEAAIELTHSAGLLILTPSQYTDISNVHIPAILGNLTAHFETGSSASITPAVLTRAIEIIDEFADCFKKDVPNPSGGTSRAFYRSLTQT